jgi:putative FmdB family regulatory protein
MPTYDYVCEACRHEFEEFQSITAKVLRKCPQCAKPKLKRLIGTGAGIIFKGSGFYETDYRSESYKKEAKAEKDAATGGGDSTDKSKSESDTKSDTKKDSSTTETSTTKTTASKSGESKASAETKKSKK